MANLSRKVKLPEIPSWVPPGMTTTSSLLNDDPILARLSAHSIAKMFESELNYALKAIRLKGQSNQQRLLNQSLLQKCWDKFSPYLSRIYLATRMIESGEYLMSTESMHNVCDSLCFSKFLAEFPNPDGAESDTLVWTALNNRASFGQAMASFVRILIMDPCLQSKRGIEETETVLINLLNVMDTCNANEDLAPIVLAGSHHVRYVVEHLSKTENHKLAIKYLKQAVELFECNIYLAGADYLPWIVSNVIALHRLLVQVNRISEANQIILSCLKKVDLMESLEKEARNVETLPAGPRELIDLSIHELNLVLFGCELRLFAGAKLVVNVDGTVHVPIKDHGEVAATTSLRKTTACSKKLATMNMPAYLQDFIKRVPVKNSLNYAGCLFTAVAPKLTKMYQPVPQFAHELATLLKQEFGPYENDPVPIPNSSCETEEYQGADVEIEGTQTSVLTKRVEPPQAGTSSRKKKVAYGTLRTPGGTKKEKVVEETEDLKTRKADFNYFITRLQCFSGDQAKLEAILEGFRAVTQGAKGLRVFEKTIEFVAKAEQLIRRMLDIGCLLLTSSPDSFSQLTALSQMQEYSVTQSETKIRFTEVNRYCPQDYCDFLNNLFSHQQWIRFKAHAPGMLHFPSLSGDKKSKIELQVKMRLSVIKYYSSLHLDRKVAFESIEENIVKSLASLVEKRYEVPEKLYQAVMNLIFVSNDCLLLSSTSDNIISIVSDAMALLWKFLEFFVKDINHSSAALPFPETSSQIIVKVLKAIHWLNSQVTQQTGDLSFTLSRKLALVLETVGDYEGAYQILKDADHSICIMRQKLGENGSLSNFRTSKVAHLTTSYAEEKNQVTLSELACVQVDVLTAKYRCHIKEQYRSTMKDLRDRMDQHFRLTKKQIILLPDFKASDVERNIKDFCGDDVTKQLLYCIVFARQATHYPLSIRKTCVKNAYKKLTEAMVSKCSSARISRGGSGGANRKIGFKVQFKNNDSVSIQALVPESEKDQSLYFQVFCRRKSLNESVSITNTQFLGTGETLYISNNVFNPVFISGLTNHETYDVFVALFSSKTQAQEAIVEEKFRVVLGQPLPLLTCAAYLCDAACSLDCLSVAQETYKITHSHFYEIQTPAENLMDSEGELKLQSYTFNRQLLQQASPSILKAFNHAIVKIVGAGSKNVPQFKEAPGATAMKYCRLFRLNACQILCTAIELAEMAGDINLQLVSASKCMDHLHPLVSDDGIGSFTTGCIFLVHRALTNSIHSLENERVKGLLEYFVPATQLLLRALTHAKHYGEAARVCDSSLSYIRKHVAIKELKVLNSNLWEQSVGLQKSEIGSQNALASSEFSFHETLAGTKNWKAGYNQVMNPLDEFCEYLEAESVLFRNKVDAQNVILSQRSLEKREIQRKVLDSSTTVRDLFVALELSQAPEAVYYDLLRFRKNPRYLELCHLVINWACRAGCVDLASKLCFELEEWLSKRNIAFFTFSSISEGSMKWEIAFRKNKKKKLASFKNIGESSTPERGRSRKVEKKKKDRRSATSRSTSAGSRSGQTYERGRRASRSVPRTQVETSKRKSIHAASQSHSPGRSTSPSVKDYKEDNAEIFKANLPRRLSYNAKRLDALVALSKQENARNSSYVTARRKRLAARKQYFQSLPAEIKDQVDKAAKTIDSLLSARWQRRRLGRRFRLILASEAPSRVQLALCHASSLKSILEKDLMFRGLLKRPIYYTNLVSKRSQTLNSDVPMPSQVQALVRDMFVQLSDGIKLARRNCLWSLLVQGIEQLYSTYNAFASVGLIDLELWSDKLWLVFYLAADDLIDFLQIATIEKSRSSQVSHTGHDLKYHTRPKLSQTLPFESWNDMYTSQYQAIWKDVDGRIQHKMVPFDLVTQFFTLSMQIMSVGKHPNRLRMLYARLRGIYPVSLDSLVSQIPEISTVVQGSSDTSTVSTISEQSESILEQESMIRAAVQEGRIDEGLLRLKNLSDLLRSNGDHKNSAVIWKRALNLIFNHSEMMYHWQDVLGVDIQRDLSTEVMKGARKAANLSENAKYLLFAGLIVTEISQSFYLHNLDMQQELVLFATVCLTGSMLYGLPEPQNLLGFRVNVPAYLSSTLLILSGQFSIDPSQMMCSLIQLQKGLIQLSAPSLAFPIVSLTNCLASTMSVVPFLKGVALLSEVNVLIKSGLHKDVLKALLDIKTGQALTGIERQCFTKSDLKLHRLGNDALANHLEVLEVGMNENAYSPVFLRLLSLTGAGYVMSLLTAGNLGQEQVEALTENLIQQLKESYMEKTKERPEPHEEPNSTWVFLSICEAMTMFQLAQLCLYQSKFGLATKWIFSVMDRLQSLDACKSSHSKSLLSYAFPNLDVLMLQSRHIAVQCLLSLGASKEAQELCQIGRSEAKALSSVEYHLIFTTLSLHGLTSTLSDTHLARKEIDNALSQKRPAQLGIVSLSFEHLGDAFVRHGHHQDAVEMYDRAYDTASTEMRLRVKLKQAAVAYTLGFNDLSGVVVERCVTLAGQNETVPLELHLCLKLNQARAALDAGALEKIGVLRSDLLALLESTERPLYTLSGLRKTLSGVVVERCVTLAGQNETVPLELHLCLKLNQARAALDAGALEKIGVLRSDLLALLESTERPLYTLSGLRKTVLLCLTRLDLMTNEPGQGASYAIQAAFLARQTRLFEVKLQDLADTLLLDKFDKAEALDILAVQSPDCKASVLTPWSDLDLETILKTSDLTSAVESTQSLTPSIIRDDMSTAIRHISSLNPLRPLPVQRGTEHWGIGCSHRLSRLFEAVASLDIPESYNQAVVIQWVPGPSVSLIKGVVYKCGSGQSDAVNCIQTPPLPRSLLADLKQQLEEMRLEFERSLVTGDKVAVSLGVKWKNVTEKVVSLFTVAAATQKELEMSKESLNTLIHITDPSIGCMSTPSSITSQLSPDPRTIDWFCVSVGLGKRSISDSVSSRADLHEEGSVGLRKSGFDISPTVSTSRGGSGGKM